MPNFERRLKTTRRVNKVLTASTDEMVHLGPHERIEGERLALLERP